MSKHEFVSAEISAGQLNAVVKHIMRQTRITDPVEAVRQFNAGQWVLSDRRWEEQNGVIVLSVTSDNTTGPEWISRLEGKGVCVCELAKQFLCSPDFYPTDGTVYKIAVLRGKSFQDIERTINGVLRNIQVFQRPFIPLNAEAACLIREKFSDREIMGMGLTGIAIMSGFLRDSMGDRGLLIVSCGASGHILTACHITPDFRWSTESGFALEIQG